jgi:hypothetical protein
MGGTNPQAGTGYAAFRYYKNIIVENIQLDTYIIPANLIVNNEINNNLVHIGSCIKNNSTITQIENNFFNACPYHLDLIESYSSGKSWYNVYSNGWCIQGGRINPNIGTLGTVTFLKPFKNTNYTVVSNQTTDTPYIFSMTNRRSPSTCTWYKESALIDGEWIAFGFIK